MALLELKVGDPLTEVVIRTHVKNRSLEQLAYLWRMHQEASEHIGHTIDELHYYCCVRFLGSKAIMIEDQFIAVPITTTCGPEGKKLTVSEMANFITQVEVFYAEQGVKLEKVYGTEGGRSVA